MAGDRPLARVRGLLPGRGRCDRHARSSTTARSAKSQRGYSTDRLPRALEPAARARLHPLARRAGAPARRRSGTSRAAHPLLGLSVKALSADRRAAVVAAALDRPVRVERIRAMVAAAAARASVAHDRGDRGHLGLAGARPDRGRRPPARRVALASRHAARAAVRVRRPAGRAHPAPARAECRRCRASACSARSARSSRSKTARRRSCC